MQRGMKCFKLIFRHTWQPEQVCDSAKRTESSKVEGAENDETELAEVKATDGHNAPIRVDPLTQKADARLSTCKNSGCRGRLSHDPRSESPWHLLKTIFLFTMIAALVIWIIVYTLLAQYEIL